jgi:hypothetical protein
MTNESFMRIICDVCGRITMTPVMMDCSAMIYRSQDGSDRFLRLCPEHKAQWERMMSDFLSQKDTLELPSLMKRWNTKDEDVADVIARLEEFPNTATVSDAQILLHTLRELS